MILFGAVLLTLVTLGFVAYPFFRNRMVTVEAQEDEALGELYSRRDTTYSMIKELEFDYQSGILSQEDYKELESRYKNKAVSILKNIDNVKEGAEAEDEIEEQIKRLRQSRVKSASAEDKIEREIKGLRQGGVVRFCPQCGAKRQPADRFCSYCGTNLKREKA